MNIDRLQEVQAKKESETAEAVVVRAARDCYKWVLCPVMQAATEREVQVEAFPLNTGATSLSAEIDRVCEENELIISAWSPLHLRNRLRELYWKDGRTVAKAMSVWEDMQKYLYLPRLKNRSVYEQAIATGAAGKDLFGIAYGQAGDKLEGFRLGAASVQLDDTLLLVEPSAAAAYAAAEDAKAAAAAAQRESTQSEHVADPKPQPATGGSLTVIAPQPTPQRPGSVPPPRAKAFFGSIDVNATTAKMKLVSIAEEIIAVLAADPNATVKVTVEISADFPNGATDQTKRAVTENAAALGFKSKLWE